MGELSRVRIAILLATFNRVETTLNALTSIFEIQRMVHGIQVFVCDGGSTDGTAEEIKKLFPHVHLTTKTDAYWNTATLTAWESAVGQDFDYYLWMNDDLKIFVNPVIKLLSSLEETPKSCVISVGQVIDPDSGKIVYSGLKAKNSLQKYSFVPIVSSEMRPDTFNGNFVLIPRCVVSRIGMLDNKFSHGFGDIDYGLRATKNFLEIQLIGIIGETPYNKLFARSISRVPVLRFFKVVKDKKLLPYREVLHFYRKHEPILWPLYVAWRYLRTLRIK